MWRRVGRHVGSHPASTAAVVTLILVVGALGYAGGREPLPFSEAFREAPDSVLGEQVISDRFIPGRAAPLSIVTDGLVRRGGHRRAQHRAPDADPGDVRDGRLGAERSARTPLLEAYLNLEPFSDEATDTIPGLRRTAQAASPGARVLIGGEVAEAYDTREALGRDTRLIVPIGLGADHDHPDRAAARDRHAALRDRHGDPVVRVRARA